MASDPPQFGFEAFGQPRPPGATTPEQQRTAAAVVKLVGFLQPHLRGGFLYGAVSDDETESSRCWSAWELTGYNHGNTGMAVALPDILSTYVNGQFRMSPEARAEDARRARVLQGYYCGFVQQPRGQPLDTEPRAPKAKDQLARALHSANVTLAEWLSAYLLVGHVLTKDDQIAAIIKTSIPPGMSPRAYWQSVLVIVGHAQVLYLGRAGFQPMVSIMGRISMELRGIVELRPPTLQELTGGSFGL